MSQKLSIYFNKSKSLKSHLMLSFFRKIAETAMNLFLQHQANFLTHAWTYDTASWGAFFFCREVRAALKSARKLLSIDNYVKETSRFRNFWDINQNESQDAIISICQDIYPFQLKNINFFNRRAINNLTNLPAKSQIHGNFFFLTINYVLRNANFQKRCVENLQWIQPFQIKITSKDIKFLHTCRIIFFFFRYLIFIL